MIRRVRMPSRLSRLLWSPFFISLNMRPLLHSLGKTQLSPTKKLLSTVKAVEISSFNNSVWTNFTLGTFLFLITYFSVSTSAWEAGPVVTAISFDGSGTALAPIWITEPILRLASSQLLSILLAYGWLSVGVALITQLLRDLVHCTQLSLSWSRLCFTRKLFQQGSLVSSDTPLDSFIIDIVLSLEVFALSSLSLAFVFP